MFASGSDILIKVMEVQRSRDEKHVMIYQAAIAAGLAGIGTMPNGGAGTIVSDTKTDPRPRGISASECCRSVSSRCR